MRYAQHTTPPAKLAREELCIQFINTVAWRLADHSEDRVATPDALLSWLESAGLMGSADVRRFSARWNRMPREAALFLKSSAELREAIYSLMVARIEHKQADGRSLAILNAHLKSPRGPQLAPARNALKWRSPNAERDELFAPIAWSAATLLMGPRSTKIRQCQDERGCGWLFLDESRAQNRRWCSMGDCGNIAKSRRHYRHTGQASAGRRKSRRTT
jgi:predicted RNA-binding Zn ribbon-like protein